ncbi:MAG: glycogen/starch/alpha-glucan phosphorylase, partial [Candidatus Omnitrophica bacterium]|nr:glycogen/starch/alpha-glucan phosphorylase [Candidatus Omnitrophota bacterium]
EQMLLYRKVSLQLLAELKEQGLTKEKFTFIENEIYTTLVTPDVIHDEFQNNPAFDDVLIHHINHTVVPAGMPLFDGGWFDKWGIDKSYAPFVIKGGQVHLADQGGIRSDFITGVAWKHTIVLREDVLTAYANKVLHEDIFGITNGVHLAHWQHASIRVLINKYKRHLGNIFMETKDFLARLEADRDLWVSFMEEFLQFKKSGKEILVKWLVSRGYEVSPNSIFVSYTRRIVPYKGMDRVVSILENEEMRRKFLGTKIVLLIGGRAFDGWARQQLDTIRELTRTFPELRNRVIVIEDYNYYMAPVIFHAVDATVMISDDNKEASATSMMKGLVNGALLIASPDGAVPELLIDIRANKSDGTGFEISYDVIDRPMPKSIVKALTDLDEILGQEENDQGAAFVYNAFKMGMMRSDISRRQARGIITLWNQELEDKFSRIKAEGRIINDFVQSIEDPAVIKEIIEGKPGIQPFEFFTSGGNRNTGSGDLLAFVSTLEDIFERGLAIANDYNDFLRYIARFIEDQDSSVKLLQYIKEIVRNKNVSPYEKIEDLISITYKLVDKLLHRGVDLGIAEKKIMRFDVLDHRLDPRLRPVHCLKLGERINIVVEIETTPGINKDDIMVQLWGTDEKGTWKSFDLHDEEIEEGHIFRFHLDHGPSSIGTFQFTIRSAIKGSDFKWAGARDENVTLIVDPAPTPIPAPVLVPTHNVPSKSMLGLDLLTIALVLQAIMHQPIAMLVFAIIIAGLLYTHSEAVNFNGITGNELDVLLQEVIPDDQNLRNKIISSRPYLGWDDLKRS